MDRQRYRSTNVALFAASYQDSVKDILDENVAGVSVNLFP